MNELLVKIIEEGEWKPLRFTVYNYLDEKEFYQLHLRQKGYSDSIEDLECKTIEADNETAQSFKTYVEKGLQKGNVIIAVCVIDKSNFITVVKPKNVDIIATLANEKAEQ